MLLLSYPLSKNTPYYGNAKKVSIQRDRDIACGDTANTLDLHFSNHSGTHIDAPYHFDKNGKKITDYSPDFWSCKNVLCLKSETLPSAGEQLGMEQFEEALKNAKNEVSEIRKNSHTIEAILWQTGWYAKRKEDEYALAGPGMATELADFLRAKFSNIRFFGFDLISLSSFANREAGREAHRAFLCHAKPILPIEDMNLENMPVALGALKNLLISPLLIEEGDGAPVTVWGNI